MNAMGAARKYMDMTVHTMVAAAPAKLRYRVFFRNAHRKLLSCIFYSIMYIFLSTKNISKSIIMIVIFYYFIFITYCYGTTLFITAVVISLFSDISSYYFVASCESTYYILFFIKC